MKVSLTVNFIPFCLDSHTESSERGETNDCGDQGGSRGRSDVIKGQDGKK